MKLATRIGLIVSVFLLFFNCEKENMNSSYNTALHFSSDTITFDTLFTSIGSSTKNLRVINHTNENVMISSIKLAGGDQSSFKMNVNGEPTNETFNLVIPAQDSIYIFIQATLTTTGNNTPLITEDSILFRVDNYEQKVRLMAWGQDFELIKSDHIKNSIWDSQKPYLVYNEATVDSGETLIIKEGTTIYFHKNAGLNVKGTLKVFGTKDEPVEFRGDRLEPSYNDLPDQWNGILLYSGSHNNIIDHAIIKNANIGLQVGTVEHAGFASIELSNTRIENMSWSGIWAMKSKIIAYNCVISNVRYYNTALLLGGDYQFSHTTFANYYSQLSSGMRTTETLIVSNYLVDNNSGTKYIGELKEASFRNCIIAGNRTNELMVSMDPQGASNYLFDKCLIQLADTFKFREADRYVDIIRNTTPLFKSPYKGNFELDTLSTAKDIGRASSAKIYPTDIKDNNRLSDQGPDLGAYERIEKKLN